MNGAITKCQANATPQVQPINGRQPATKRDLCPASA